MKWIVLCISLLSLSAHAVDQFIAEGSGPSLNQAKKMALRAALRQALALQLTPEIIIKQRDKIQELLKKSKTYAQPVRYLYKQEKYGIHVVELLVKIDEKKLQAALKKIGIEKQPDYAAVVKGEFCLTDNPNEGRWAEWVNAIINHPDEIIYFDQVVIYIGCDDEIQEKDRRIIWGQDIMPVSSGLTHSQMPEFYQYEINFDLEGFYMISFAIKGGGQSVYERGVQEGFADYMNGAFKVKAISGEESAAFELSPAH